MCFSQRSSSGMGEVGCVLSLLLRPGVRARPGSWAYAQQNLSEEPAHLPQVTELTGSRMWDKRPGLDAEILLGASAEEVVSRRHWGFLGFFFRHVPFLPSASLDACFWPGKEKG